MHTRPTVAWYSIALAAVFVVGCSASVSKPKGDGTVFAAPLQKTQEAATNALTVHGFDLKKQEPGYVEGTRPRKVGLFVGSGGETVWSRQGRASSG
jgi:hypothetical protein